MLSLSTAFQYTVGMLSLSTAFECSAGMLSLSTAFEELSSHIVHGFSQTFQITVVVPLATLPPYFTLHSHSYLQTLPSSLAKTTKTSR
jgi:hypothetical protein